mmetsp:Transcript_9561/g.24437  ORF Transcript_9561/g.24437 Transcript_9561/m.24437 type:complete len:228 (-) Transcript_9561:4625-5308(-)
MHIPRSQEACLDQIVLTEPQLLPFFFLLDTPLAPSAFSESAFLFCFFLLPPSAMARVPSSIFCCLLDLLGCCCCCCCWDLRLRDCARSCTLSCFCCCCCCCCAADADGWPSFGATNAASLCLALSSKRFCCCAFCAICFCSRFCSFVRKYSPLSSCKSILLGCWGGGKGVYTFFFLTCPSFASFTACNGFLRLMFFFLNLGRNLSQFSCASAGSLANSRLIISALMW